MQLEIGCDPTEVSRARRWARSQLADSCVDQDDSLVETLILLISELVTNAVVHARCPALLRMALPPRRGAGAVRVEVLDNSNSSPRQRRAADAETGGRGLELVSGLADRWGWQRESTGKRVWCELDSQPTPEPATNRFAASVGVGAGVGQLPGLRELGEPDEFDPAYADPIRA